MVVLIHGTLVPFATPLIGMLMLGNLLKESAVVERLTKASSNELANVVGNLLIVAARTSGAGSKGVSLFVLETENLPGFRVGRLLEKIGMQASDTAELFFDNVRVPAANIIGELNLGFIHMMERLAQERIGAHRET